MNYQKIYNSLISKRKDYPIYKENQYCESHHIVPKSLGGTNDKCNLVNLTAREHYVAHLLLWKHYKFVNDINAQYKMANAIKRMINGNKEFELNILKFNSKLYEHARLDAINFLKSLECSTKGRRFIHNKVTNKNKMIPRFDPLPDGYEEGVYLSSTKRNKMSLSTKGKIYIRNLKTTELKQISKDDIIPVGWERRRTKLNLTKEQKEIHRLNAIGNKGQSGKITIVNDETGKRKFIFPNEKIPDGWHKRKQKIAHYCIDCGKEIVVKTALRCHKCANKLIAKTRKPIKKQNKNNQCII